MSIILGINAFHPDASACLLIDGELVAAVAEERLGSRDKHTMSFPTNAIKWVMSFGGVRLKDISSVAVAKDPRANLFAKFLYSAKNFMHASDLISKFINRQRNTSSILYNLADVLGEAEQECKYSVEFIEHHLAHLCSSYFVSDFEAATGFSYDGSGDFSSAMYAVCEGTNITVKDRVKLPHSLGHFYTALCQFIGFDRFGEEYKVMGLAPYGNDTFQNEMDALVDISTPNWFRLNQKYFDTYKGLSLAKIDKTGSMQLGSLYSKHIFKLLGHPRNRDEEISQREKDIAKSTQRQFERASLKCLGQIDKQKKIENLVMAGGCALNGVTNAKLLRDLDIKNMYLQSAASDDGTAIGAAYACWHLRLGFKKRFHMKHSFWGPEYSDKIIVKEIYKGNFYVKTFKDEYHKIKESAELIKEGYVVGWYQGRSEWGPRALGNRSILANPLIPKMKEIINKKIKKREAFRPFAPSVLREDVPIYFEQNINSPFMMHVVKFKNEFSKKFPSVTHVDGTGRLQSVSEENNPTYYKLIKEFKKLTGYGIILNTSFNENEPIVDTPGQAISCFRRTDLDALVIGNYILKKNPI